MSQPAIRILVVDDESAIRRALRPPLVELGFQVFEASRGEEAIQQLRAATVDVVLLDMNMPGIGGMETLRRIRAIAPRLPILMVTVRDAEEEKVEALELGADDYVTKPFGARELLARIVALGRRAKSAPAEPEIIELDGCRFDLGHCEARRNHKIIPLSPREVGIVRWLHRHRARVVSRSELLEQLWGANADTETRTVDVTVAHLRQKIERDHAKPAIIISVQGVGYAWGQR